MRRDSFLWNLVIWVILITLLDLLYRYILHTAPGSDALIVASFTVLLSVVTDRNDS